MGGRPRLRRAVQDAGRVCAVPGPRRSARASRSADPGGGDGAGADRPADPRGDQVRAARIGFQAGARTPSQAITLYLHDGSRTDIVAVSSPRFPVSTPDAFIELVLAQGAGLAAAWKLPRFFARHREALRALPVLAPTLAAPASYATVPYYAIHAFEWIDAGGAGRCVRYQLWPEVTQRKPAPWQARRRAADYLQQELSSEERRV